MQIFLPGVLIIFTILFPYIIKQIYYKFKENTNILLCHNIMPYYAILIDAMEMQLKWLPPLFLYLIYVEN